ncbi:MAG: hypothetical protein CFE21_08615 [Bacteroidetes bacterium B1(2017)]|nr:MAG: hypothetical protein CFE21_08615 [Bacteroidetes bacterium B1(2017)]
MKKIITTAAVCILLVVSACKKESSSTTNTTTPTSTCMVQSINYGDGSADSYTYDSQNRLSRNVFVQDTLTSQTDYTYAGKIVTAATAGGFTQLFYLNSNGFADSSVMDYAGIIHITSVYKYNSQNQATSMITSGNYFTTPVNESTTYEYTGGNKSKETYNDGTTTSVTTYDYYTDKADPAKKSMEAINFVNGNTNLLKTETVDGTDVTSYTYEYDSTGKPTKRTATSTGNPVVSTIAWTCK